MNNSRWKAFLTENNDDIITHNAEIIKNSSVNFTHHKIYDLARFHPALLAQSCPPLTREKIKRFVAKGTTAIVFELKNGRILKIFAGGYLGTETGNDEVEHFKSSETDLWKGKGSKRTIPAFESGHFTVEVRNKAIRNNLPDIVRKTNLSYVVMARLITLSDYFGEARYRLVSSPLDDGEIDKFLRKALALTRTHLNKATIDRHIQDFIDTQRVWHQEDPSEDDINIRKQRFISTKKQEAILNKQEYDKVVKDLNIQPYEARNMLITLKNVFTEKGSRYLNDLHSGNMGVLPNSVRTKNPQFILFDP